MQRRDSKSTYPFLELSLTIATLHPSPAQIARRATLSHPARLVSSGKSERSSSPSRAHWRGVSRSSRTVERGMRWPHRVAAREHGPEKCVSGFPAKTMLKMRADERAGADGQAVWSRHPDAGVWSATMPTTGANKPGPLGEHGAAVKTIAQGRPVVSANPVVTAACFSCCRRAMGAASTRPSP